MRVLGVHCTAKYAFLSVAEGGLILELGASRLAAAQSTDADAALWETLGSFEDALDEVNPDRIALLLPGTGPNAMGTHAAWAPRVQLETLLRMAAAKRDIPVEQLARAAALSRLNLPRKGKFELVVKPVVPETGGYWMAGRLAAAAAALAVKDV